MINKNEFEVLFKRTVVAPPRQAENTEIKIYNIKGQLIRNLPVASLPDHSIEAVWDGKDEKGKEVSAGVYFYKLAGRDKHIGKVVKLE